MARLSLQNVSKWYGLVPGVQNISFDVEDRELFVMVGPSGCGKTTLLRLIAGLDDVTEGKIFIDKRVVNHDPPKARNVSMVFQNYALYPHMTVMDNMSFGLRMRGYSDEEIQARVRQAAEMLDLVALLNRKPSEISGGQRQRVAVGRAIVRKPKVFLFDEPFSNLDAKLRGETRGELIRLHQRLQTTMIYVTHDQVEAMTLGDRIAVLKDGAGQQIGKPIDLYRRPKNRFVAEFIGSPPMNFFNVTVLDRGDSVWLDQGHFQLKLPPRYRRTGFLKDGLEILLGVRPEDIHDRLFQTGAVTEGNTVIAMVQLVEPVGAETHVHLDAGGTRFIARVHPDNPLEMNQPMELVFDLDKIHLFSRNGKERFSLEA
ncbi:MAG: sn-glycerol-3-phosphate ABC transporter ATP-binding protein UgpC [Elusimicrobia bacterium]|nr:sn-glycerol-3-phosphate ABC transporter ATP-binding protein UgpC [Elusimicrobiota bacterium]